MKKLQLVILITLGSALFTFVQAQYGWTQKASLTAFGGREGATAFTIGHYGFIGGGQANSGFLNDMWKWDQTTNTWSVIATYPGAGRYGIASFTINGKGYCCLGWSGSGEPTDLWEYDTATNSWTQKANFPGAGRDGAFAFVIGTKAYIGSGEPNSQPYDQDVWMYDALANTWTQVASLPLTPRVSAMVAFSLNGYGYAGCGGDGLGTSYNEMFKYDPNTNTWSSVASLPVPGIEDAAVSFVIDSLAYVGTGIDASDWEYFGDFWSYNPRTNAWSAIATLPGSTRWSGVGFSIGNKGYVGTGGDSLGNYLPDYWEYAPLAALTVSAGINENVTCNGGNNGSATITPAGGNSPYTYLWSPGGQTTSTDNGLQAGIYIITVTDNSGSTSTITVTITQPAPIIVTSYSASARGRCNGSAWVSVNGGVSPYTYLWSGGQTTDSISCLCPGNYCCTVTDANGCSLTTCLSIGGCSNNYDEPICLVTVDAATNKAEVIWGRTNSPDSGSYNIYREGSSAYTLIQNQPITSLSEYEDFNSNPSVGPVSYELSTVNSCCESPLSVPQSTMYLLASSGTNEFILNWTPYVGFTPSEYLILRGTSINSMEEIASVSNTVLTYHDNMPPANSIYMLEAVSPGICTPFTHHLITSGEGLSGSYSNVFNTDILAVQSVGASSADLNIYPNPNNGTFTIQISNNEQGILNIEVIDELGQVVYSENKNTHIGLNTEQLNLENLAAGIYTLKVQSSGGITVKKLVVMQR